MLLMTSEYNRFLTLRLGSYLLSLHQRIYHIEVVRLARYVQEFNLLYRAELHCSYIGRAHPNTGTSLHKRTLACSLTLTFDQSHGCIIMVPSQEHSKVSIHQQQATITNKSSILT